MNSKIAIIGCGWLGLPLAESLVQNGYDINGSTTSEVKLKTLKDSGIRPFLISLSASGIDGNILEFLRDVTTLIVNVPPKLRSGNPENYVAKMRWLHQVIKKTDVQKLIFISSTSVYGAVEGEVSEETEPRPNTESGRQLLASEILFMQDSHLKTTVLRFGGLIGRKRHPVNMLAGKKDLANGNHPINLIHLDDCIQIIQSIIEYEWWNEIFNAVYPFHPKKKEYYTLEAQKRGLQVPDYKDDSQNKGKKVVSKKLISDKNLEFLHKI